MKYLRNQFTKQERRLKFNYYNFIKSDWWIKQKEDWFSRHKKRCAICKSEYQVHLHHKKYPKNGRFLSMRDNTFIALCKKHHFEYHKLHGVNQNMQKTSTQYYKNNVVPYSQKKL